jgi:hypothetical protein
MTADADNPGPYWLRVAQPYLLVILTALVSGYLVERVSRNWQNHQIEVETKVALVESIGGAVSDLVLAVQFVEADGSLSQADFDQAYRDWERQAAMIGAKLRAYYSDDAVAQAWDDFTRTVNAFYALTGVDESHLQYHVAGLRNALELDDWETLADPQAKRDRSPGYRQAWWQLREALLAKKDRIVRRLLDTPMTAFAA